MGDLEEIVLKNYKYDTSVVEVIHLSHCYKIHDI